MKEFDVCGHRRTLARGELFKVSTVLYQKTLRGSSLPFASRDAAFNDQALVQLFTAGRDDTHSRSSVFMNSSIMSKQFDR